MPSATHIPSNLADLYHRYCQELTNKAPDSKYDATALVRTALFYALRMWGLPPHTTKKLTQAAVQTGFDLMKQISLADFFDKALHYQQIVFDDLEISPDSQRTYRMHLRKILQYGQEQGWDVQTSESQQPKKTQSDYSCPRIQQGRGRVSDVRVSNRKLTSSSPQYAYALKDCRISKDHQTELKLHLDKQFGSQESQVFQLELAGFYKGCKLSPELQHCTQKILQDPEISVQLRKALSKFLQEHEIHPRLQLELDSFHEFQSAVSAGRKRQDKAIRSVSAEGHVNSVKRHLGWLYRYQKVPLDQLNLSILVASSGLDVNGQRDDVAIDKVLDDSEEFIHWLQNERGVCPSTELKAIQALVAVAKYLYHGQSKPKSRGATIELTGSSKRVGYRDIPLVEEFRGWECEIMSRVKTAPPTSDISKKWVDWPVFKACVERLRQECAPAHHKKRRSKTAIAQSHQMCLMFALLAAFPDRSRTITELEVGRTLFKRDDQWVIQHTAADFKTGDSFCKNGGLRIVPLPAELTALMDEWLDNQRAVFNPQHPYVFTQKNGKPMTKGSVNGYFCKRTYRLTGKVLNIHLVRTIVITHFKLSSAPDGVLRALADLMAHSVKTQQEIYDKRTSGQKVAPALQALASEPAGVLPLQFF